MSRSLLSIMSENEKTIKAFADSFDPPLNYGRTERINNVKVADAWTCSHWDKTTGLGYMAVAHNGGIRCFMEGAGVGPDAAGFYGRAISNAISLAPLGGQSD